MMARSTGDEVVGQTKAAAYEAFLHLNTQEIDWLVKPKPGVITIIDLIVPPDAVKVPLKLLAMIVLVDCAVMVPVAVNPLPPLITSTDSIEDPHLQEGSLILNNGCI
jgi:hypothetical protein